MPALFDTSRADLTAPRQANRRAGAPATACPHLHATGHPTERDDGAAAVDPDAAMEFLELLHAEAPQPVSPAARMAQVRAEIDATGTYEHTLAELTFGARVAWRNSARCIGRLYWNGLHVRDRRACTTPGEIAAECVAHLRSCTRGGRIRSTLTVFAPDRPGRPGPRIENEQLIRYAGHRRPDGGVLGDPRTVGLTDRARNLGWRPAGPAGPFDVLPLLVTGTDGRTEMHALPADAVLEVPLTHPDHPWFAELGLRWHAVPAISDMTLEIGGVRYPAAPFNGYYLGTEIGARNLADADRYDMLPVLADRLGLDTSHPRTLWKDRALVELMVAVHHSYDAAGVTMADHHTESERFLAHRAREHGAGRACPTDWSWIVPPVSSGTTAVFHHYYDPVDPTARPAFLPRRR